MAVNVDELATRYQNLLKDEGYACQDPKKDEAANTLDLVVKYEGVSFLIILDYDDPSFVRILLPNFFTIEEGKIGDALTAVHDVAKKCKGAKVYLSNELDDATASAEYLENGNSVETKQLIRYLSMIRNAAMEFAKAMRK